MGILSHLIYKRTICMYCNSLKIISVILRKILCASVDCSFLFSFSLSFYWYIAYVVFNLITEEAKEKLREEKSVTFKFI